MVIDGVGWGMDIPSSAIVIRGFMGTIRCSMVGH